MAHTTGGGFIDNIPRILPNHLKAILDTCFWSLPPIMKYFKSISDSIHPTEFARTWNCGIGMILIVDKKTVNSFCSLFKNKSLKYMSKVSCHIVDQKGKL